MSVKIDAEIRAACTEAKAKGVKIAKAFWFELDANSQVIGCDPIGAVLLRHNKVSFSNPLNVESLSKPGFIKEACLLLDVDPGWLYRFWMGYDRNYQIWFTTDDKKEIKDDVSSYGISMAKELL